MCVFMFMCVCLPQPASLRIFVKEEVSISVVGGNPLLKWYTPSLSPSDPPQIHAVLWRASDTAGGPNTQAPLSQTHTHTPIPLCRRTL